MLEARQVVLAGPLREDTIIVNAVMMALAWTAVSLRVYTRSRIVNIFLIEDYLMVASVLCFTVYCGTAIYITKLVALGTSATLPLGTVLATAKYLLVAECFYIWTMLILKISIGVFLLRVALDRWTRLLIHASMLLSAGFGIVLFFFTAFQCGVVDNMLDFVSRRLQGKCASSTSIAAMSYTHGAITAATDWVYVILPIFVIKSLSMRRRDKCIAGALMAFASVSGIASLIRFRYIGGLTAPTPTFFTTATNIAIWSCIEPGVGITAGSIICIRPLLRWQKAKLSKHMGSAGSWARGKLTPYERDIGENTIKLGGRDHRTQSDLDLCEVRIFKSAAASVSAAWYEQQDLKTRPAAIHLEMPPNCLSHPMPVKKRPCG